MICPVCQSDNVKVFRSTRGINTDSRIVKCGECNTYFDTETKITHIIHDSESIPIDKAKELLSEKWDKFRERKYKQTRMF